MTTVPDRELSLQKGGLTFTFLPSGDLQQAIGGGMMINQLPANPIDGAAGNLFARVHMPGGIYAFPITGVKSRSRFGRSGDRLVWAGEIGAADVPGLAHPLRYQVVFTLTEHGVWFWDVMLQGHGVQADVIYTQDVGIAAPGAVTSNEAYLSQYIDHSVYEHGESGYVVCSRQNQPQGGKFPYLQQGSLCGAAGYSTDGFQFFGLSYKETDRPEALYKKQLANEIYQYEFAYTALQSHLTPLGGEAHYTFYGLFREDHPAAVTELEFGDLLRTAREQAAAPGEITGEAIIWRTPVRLSPRLGTPLLTEALTAEEVQTLFPVRRQEESENGELLSFFTDTYEHVVLKAKELLVERPHGHILMSGDNARLNPEVITTTSYMYGIFNSQVVVGNTNFNKMISNSRNALNLYKTSGQRIYVEVEGQYRLLTMPSLYEIGLNYTRWYYKTASDTLIVTNYTRNTSPEIRLELRSAKGIAYRYLVTHQVTMNVAEYEIPYHISEDSAGALTFRAASSSVSAGIYPGLAYRMTLDGSAYRLGDESLLAEAAASGGASLAVLELEASSAWGMTLQGLLEGELRPAGHDSFEQETEDYRQFLAGVMNGFKLEQAGGEGELFKVNALAWWYTHNMLVHYSVPHGLEQYGGAAWGTRDVCQGPVEYFLATRKYEQVREILLTVFKHQYDEDGNWPQWFMFDKYAAIQQEESHGDIIVWPLKVLGDYLQATRDFALLDELVPYTRKHGFAFTEQEASVREHALKELEYIRNHFLHGTFLSSYGDGDWDDTLQPANAQLKQYMVSSWTVALTYQAVLGLSAVLREYDTEWADELSAMAEGIKADYNRYILSTDVIPGFLYFEDPAQPKLMLHPDDQETGIQYRLLPMTRSMIAGLLTKEQMEAHYELILQQFLCPDGVRLMNHPAQYAGGVSMHFKRAEQAANFGREIGLQYVHAHIRFVEAMAKIGKRDQVWKGLLTINPIGIRESVPNAELRQSNAYFSSSDGKFATRYEAGQRFSELREGKVPVKGGWRIYSSGPGIYMNQLISNVLGIREDGGDLIIDPVLPLELDGLTFHFHYAGKPVVFVYHNQGESLRTVSVNGREAEAQRLDNPYRLGGLRVPQAEIERLRYEEQLTIDIYM